MQRLFCAVALVAAVACSSGDGSGEQATDTGAPVTEGASSAGSCIETYTLGTLENREFAFDGTVTSVEDTEDAQRVTFDVRAWFKGGDGDEAVLTAYGFGGITSAGGERRSVGDRLLVAGDEDFLWECGFTQPYDAAVAEQWEQTLR